MTSRTSISFLFPEKRPSPFGWEALLCVYPALQRKRLTWRHTDPAFGQFIDFLETHGAASSLADDEWKATFSRMLDYLPNQHFLFMLWLGRGQSRGWDDQPPLESWLPAKLAKNFADWKEHWEYDRKIMQAVDANSSEPGFSRALNFRGIPLASALDYRVLAELIVLHRKKAAKQ